MDTHHKYQSMVKTFTLEFLEASKTRKARIYLQRKFTHHCRGNAHERQTHRQTETGRRAAVSGLLNQTNPKPAHYTDAFRPTMDKEPS